MDKFQRDLDNWLTREQPEEEVEEEVPSRTCIQCGFTGPEGKWPPCPNCGYDARGHRYSIDTDRCICGGQVVYFEDQNPEGEGCEVEGKPWATGYTQVDPDEDEDPYDEHYEPDLYGPDE